MKNSDPRLYKPSGLNSQFHGKGLSFDAYIHQTQAMLRATRLDLSSGDSDTIIMANSPIEWRPHNFNGKRGILLIHGLLDSPFIMRDLARHFLNRGFLVRSLLLPGHGTVPGDLIGIHRQEWIKAVDYGVESFKGEAQEIYLSGFSLGGALATHKAQRDNDIAGLVLLAPAVSIIQSMLAKILRYYSRLGNYIPCTQWLAKRPQVDYTKYESFAVDGAYQTYELAAEVKKAAKHQPLNLPVFVAQCAIDEVIQATGVINFFANTTNPRNQMLFYANNNPEFKDKRIIHQESAYPEEKILDLSHLALPISPENPHYGIHGDYQDFLLYPNQKPPAGTVYLGPRNRKLLKKHIIQRITFNPDFMGMTRAIDKFLAGLNK